MPHNLKQLDLLDICNSSTVTPLAPAVGFCMLRSRRAFGLVDWETQAFYTGRAAIVWCSWDMQEIYHNRPGNAADSFQVQVQFGSESATPAKKQ